MRSDTQVTIVLLALIFSIAGSCVYNTAQKNGTERACIAADRAMWDEHCEAKEHAKGVRIQ